MLSLFVARVCQRQRRLLLDLIVQPERLVAGLCLHSWDSLHACRRLLMRFNVVVRRIATEQEISFRVYSIYLSVVGNVGRARHTAVDGA